MSSNHEHMRAGDAPLSLDLAALDAEGLYSGALFTGLLLRQVAQVTEPTTLIEAVNSFGLHGHCLLLTDEGLIPFIIGGEQPSAPAQANESITQQRLAFSMQREAALQADLTQARDDLFRARQEQITEMAALHEERRRVEESADTKLRKVKADLLDATHGERPQLWETAIQTAQVMLPPFLNWLDGRQGVQATPAALLPTTPHVALYPDVSNGKAIRQPDVPVAAEEPAPPPERELMQWVIAHAASQIGQSPGENVENVMSWIAEVVESNRQNGVKLDIEHGGAIVYALSKHAINLGLEADQVLAIFEPLLALFHDKLVRFSRKTGRWMAEALFIAARIDTSDEDGSAIETFAGQVFEAARKILKAAR